MNSIPLFFIVGLLLLAYTYGRIHEMDRTRRRLQELRGEVAARKIEASFLQMEIDDLRRGYAVPCEVTDRTLRLVHGGKE